MPQLEEALRNEKDHQRYIQMNAELIARLTEFGATNRSLAATLDEQYVLCREQGKRLEIKLQQLETEAGFRRELEAENKRLRAMVDKRNGSRKSGGKVGRPRKYPAPVTAEENSDPQPEADETAER